MKKSAVKAPRDAKRWACALNTVDCQGVSFQASAISYPVGELKVPISPILKPQRQRTRTWKKTFPIERERGKNAPQGFQWISNDRRFESAANHFENWPRIQIEFQ
jgi:hypothetical protein